MNDYFVFAKYVGISHAGSPKRIVRAIHNQKSLQKSRREHHGEFGDEFCCVLSWRNHAIGRSRVFYSSRHDCSKHIAAVVIFPCLLLFDLQRHVNANPDAVGNRGHSTKKEESNSKMPIVLRASDV